ncbi:MAG: response regulator transcription factor [Nocardioides sp.]
MDVVVAEDGVLFREGLERILREAGHRVRVVTNGDELIAEVRRSRPDLVISDVRMPAGAHGDGARVASTLRSEEPTLPVVLLSQHVELRHCAHLLGEPGFGYLLKDRVLALDDFLTALESVATGGAAVDPAVVRSLVGDSARASRLDALSARERQVLALAAEGHTNARIASDLGCAERTAESHMRSVFQKLDLLDDGQTHRRVLAVLAFLTDQRPTVAD